MSGGRSNIGLVPTEHCTTASIAVCCIKEPRLTGGRVNNVVHLDFIGHSVGAEGTFSNPLSCEWWAVCPHLLPSDSSKARTLFRRSFIGPHAAPLPGNSGHSKPADCEIQQRGQSSNKGNPVHCENQDIAKSSTRRKPGKNESQQTVKSRT